MPRYEYKVMPAPTKPGKIKGVKGTAGKFAAELAALMNELGAEGWEYQRTDTLPCEERHGLTGRSTTFQNMLIFRRKIVDQSENADADEAPQSAVEPPIPMPALRVAESTVGPQLSATRDIPEGNSPKIGAPDIAAQ